MVNQLVFEQDMQKEVRLRQIHGSLFENDNNGLQVGVRILRNGVAETLAGSVICEVMRRDGTLATVNGGRSGNLAYANIPSSCLMPGMVKIVIKNVVGTQKTTVLAITGAVSMINGSAFIDSGSVIPDLSSYTNLVTRAETAANTVSKLSTDAQLIAGDRYRCIVTKSS